MVQSHQKIDIKNLTRPRLVSWLENRDIKPFRANQILKWIYARQTDVFEDMTDLGKEIRSLLSRHFTIERNTIVGKETSTDGTVKYQDETTDEVAGDTLQTETDTDTQSTAKNCQRTQINAYRVQ